MFRLGDEFVPPSKPPEAAAEVQKQFALLQTGAPEERRAALTRLIAARAEHVLASCLRAEDPLTVQLATMGLWECWLGECGREARKKIEEGIARMNADDLNGAEKIFLALRHQYPDWAEAINKQATLLFLRGDAAASLELCRKVVELKPHHFGAWHGLALCAVEMEAWQTAVEAAEQALKIQPRAKANRDILQLAKAHLPD